MLFLQKARLRRLIFCSGTAYSKKQLPESGDTGQSSCFKNADLKNIGFKNRRHLF
jgi:hypothetical protein